MALEIGITVVVRGGDGESLLVAAAGLIVGPKDPDRHGFVVLVVVYTAVEFVVAVVGLQGYVGVAEVVWWIEIVSNVWIKARRGVFCLPTERS